MRTALSMASGLDPADSAMIIARSPRPLARPDGIAVTDATAKEPVTRTTKTKATRTKVGTQFTRDLNQASRQINRDLNRLFN